ncbi:MAG: DUF4389 domain-containing protein [Acidimicrobiia bacterium]
MSQIEFDVPYVEPRNRLTVAFRLILAIPHLILQNVWQNVANIAALIHWFIIVFTGKRNDSLWQFANSYVGYASRVGGYTGILFDEYPQFGTDASGVPVHYALAQQPEPANRLTVGLRIIWIIPALLIAIGVGIAGFVITIISWFAILFTGKMPRGNFDFMVKVQRYVLQTTAYGLLLTDTYPAWG